MSDKIDDILKYAKSLIGVKYTWWKCGSTSEKDHPFYVDKLPTKKYLKENGINCAGLINIMRLYSGGEIPEQYDEYVVRGGTRFWYNYFNTLGKLEVFDYKKYYPLGTLLLRDYKDIVDQGHLAVIYEHFKKDFTKILYGNIIHAYADNEEGKVGITNLGSSHFYLTNKDGEGYYEYAILPKDWLNNV